MILRKIIVLSAVFSALGAFAGGCQSGGVGDRCVPEDEYQPQFSGFAASEVNIESRSFQCETRVCLVNHFRGRVSCPLGQEADLAKKAVEYSTKRSTDASTKLSDTLSDDEKKMACYIPGSSGESAELVQTSVLPQCQTRKADDAVYCSCRCAGPDPNAKYCECPSGFECIPFPELDLGAAVAKGSSGLSGSYCVKSNDVKADKKSTKYNQGECPQAVSGNGLADKCDKSGNCGAKNNIIGN